MDYDTAHVRAVLRDHGIEVGDRGRLSADQLAAYERLTANGDAGVTEADFGHPGGSDTPAELTDLPPGGDGGGGDRQDDEDRPARPARPGWRQRVAAAGPGSRARKRRPRAKGKGPARPRVPADKFTARLWRMAARMTAPISAPVSRCLILQAPAAGIICEDIVAGTAIDRVIQPAIRAEQKAEKAFALVGPPVIVGALEASRGLPEGERAMREAILLPMLREALVANVEIAGDRLDAELERAGESEETARRVDAMLAMIFAPPGEPEAQPPPAPADEVAAAQAATAGAGA